LLALLLDGPYGGEDRKAPRDNYCSRDSSAARRLARN